MLWEMYVAAADFMETGQEATAIVQTRENEHYIEMNMTDKRDIVGKKSTELGNKEEESVRCQ